MYRPNVCALVFNEKVQFLGCQRMRSSHFQCVQGGIEAGDGDIRLAALREVEEEIGLKPKDLTFIQELPPPNGDPMSFAYTLAANASLRRFGYVGQKQRILLFFTSSENILRVVLLPPPELNASQEFQKVEWMPLDELIAKSPPEKVHILKAVGTVAPEIARAFLKEKGLLAEPQKVAKY